MDKYVDERDYKLLGNDKYTFSVLRRIIGGKCELLLTDHEKLIICFSCAPYPVWVWTADNASEMEMARAYQMVSDHSLLNGNYRFNLKYDLAKYFMDRAAADGNTLSISTNLFAYDCLNPVKPVKTADGFLYRCNSGDVDEVVDFMYGFHGSEQKKREDYRMDAEIFINTQKMFFWKDEQGNNVASCKYVTQDDMASISLVFTRPEFRRKHYAENLVYQVTKLALDSGYVPMLYTDADYIASNACYEKIGYVLKGKLCTIG